MGSVSSTTALSSSPNLFQANFEVNLLQKIMKHKPSSVVFDVARQIRRYDGSHTGYSGSKSENYILAERLWELAEPMDLAHIACTYSEPSVRLYGFEGLCVLVRTMQHYGHSPYWRLRFKPTEASIEELQDLLYCVFIHLQNDNASVHSMAGCCVNVSSVSNISKHLAWGLFSEERKKTLEDFVLHSKPDSQDAEDILKRRAENEPSLETYLLIERQLEKKPQLLRYMALFCKSRDIELIIDFLQDKDSQKVRAGIKAVTVWQHKDFWPVLIDIHQSCCRKLQENEEEPSTFSLFFELHEAIVSYSNQDAVNCVQESLNILLEILEEKNMEHKKSILIKLFRVIPARLEFGEILFTLWKDFNLINCYVLEMLLDVSGMEKNNLMEGWRAFLMGTHPRVGSDSPVRILHRKVDALDLIFSQFDTFRRRSIELISNPNFSIWKHDSFKFDKGIFCIAMDVLLTEASNDIVCSIMESCVKECTCHDASFICEYASKVSNPSEKLISNLLDCSTHWNFYVHDPARMALLCMNKLEIDERLSEVVEQPIESLSVFKAVQEGCNNGERRWKSFM